MLHKITRKTRYILLGALIVGAITLPGAVDTTHAQPVIVCDNAGGPAAIFGAGAVVNYPNGLRIFLPNGGERFPGGLIPYGANSRLILPVESNFLLFRGRNDGGANVLVDFLDPGGVSVYAGIILPYTSPVHVNTGAAHKYVALRHDSAELTILRACWEQ